MRPVALFLAILLACGLHARARMGDSPEMTVFRYGQPTATTGQPGAATSTRTFYASNLKIVCGYVGKTVEMITYTRPDRAFYPSEVEALLRTNARKKTWTPGTGFTNGTYTCSNGATATVADTQVEIQSPEWLTALAKDKAAAAKAAAVKAAQPAPVTNRPDPNYTPVLDTNAASHVDAPVKTNAAP